MKIRLQKSLLESAHLFEGEETVQDPSIAEQQDASAGDTSANIINGDEILEGVKTYYVNVANGLKELTKGDAIAKAIPCIADIVKDNKSLLYDAANVVLKANENIQKIDTAKDEAFADVLKSFNEVISSINEFAKIVIEESKKRSIILKI